MKVSPTSDRVQRIRALVQRKTGTAITAADALELIEALESGADAGTDPAAVGSHPREVTILLADLRGFMALTATLPAGTVIGMLNQCLDSISTAVYRHHGTIDKFMGDAVMALFGVPDQRDDDVARALSCAVEMQVAIRDLNVGFKADGLPELHLGIGINTGTVMAGRFGSQAYSEYTVIGEEVNLASRIEAFSLRGQVLISESTYARAGDVATVSEPMRVHVKGRREPVRLREVTGIPSRNLVVPRQEVRRSHRVEVSLPGNLQRIQNKIVMDQPLPATVRDIGYHGVLVEYEGKLEDRAELKLGFELPLVDYRASEIYAKVVNRKQKGTRSFAGLEFTSLDLLTNEKIQLFVQLLIAAR